VNFYDRRCTVGYYVSLVEADFTIPESEEVLAALKEMPKKYYSLMRGGSSNGERWFSWMNNEEIESAPSAQHVFEALGFECVDEGNNTFSLSSYSNKTGQEDLFLAVVAPFVTEDSYTEWRGEDGELWRYTVKGKKLTVQSSSVSWNYPETYKTYSYFSTGSFEDKTYQSHSIYVDPYGDVDAQLEEKKAKLVSNA
jgi:hypothetical protein